MPQGCFDLRKLVEVLALEDLVEPVGFCFDPAEPPGLFEEGGLEASAREFRSLTEGGNRGEDGAGLA